MFEGNVEAAVKTSIWQPLANVDKECFGCGADNPHGLQLKYECDGTRLRSQLTLEKRFRGWSNLIHGGILSTILDETMGWTVFCLTRKFMLTKGMQVHFIKPIRIGTPVTVTGYIKEWINERKIAIVAEITDENGEICTSSSGEFALFSRDHFLKMNIMSEQEVDAMITSISSLNF